MSEDNPFDLDLPAYVTPEPEETGQRRRRRRPEHDPAIGEDPEYWTPLEPEDLPPPDSPGAPGFHGDWDAWARDLRARQAAREFEAVADEDRPALPPLKDFGGGGAVVRGRRARRDFDDGRVDQRRFRGAAMVGSAGAVVLVVLVVLVVNVFVLGGDPAPAPAVAAVSSAPRLVPATPTSKAPRPGYATAECDTVRTPSLTVGALDGDTSSAQNAILGFEFAYYVRRDASKARSYATEDARIGSESAIAAGIQDTPPGTRYCVYIMPLSPGVWNVSLHQQFPDEPVEKIAQRITTREVSPGSFRIVDVAKA